MSVIQVCQIDVAYVLLYDLWSKSLKHTFIAPVHPFQLILGSWLIGVIRSFVVFLLLFRFSALAFGFDFLRPGFGPAPLPARSFPHLARGWDQRLYPGSPFRI